MKSIKIDETKNTRRLAREENMERRRRRKGWKVKKNEGEKREKVLTLKVTLKMACNSFKTLVFNMGY